MKKTLLTFALLGSMAFGAAADVQKEKLDRGVVAMKTDSGVFLSWRSLEEDPFGCGFDIYRDGVKITAEPINSVTNYVDADGTASSKYVIKTVLNGADIEESKAVTTWADQYLRLKLDRPTGSGCTYSPNDCSVGDVDGDGQYEIFVKWDPSNSHDNSQNGNTGNVYIDCYTLEGQKLWRVDLGQNIRAGAHYTQFMVYDFDGDGKAEMICKTAPGTKDANGKAVLMGSDKVTDSYVNSKGHIITGPEYLTVFNGQTGAEVTTIAYNPPRDIKPIDKSHWGDDYGGRSERYLAGVAYLDGQHPTAIFCRGYYTYSYLWAVDFDGKDLKEVWLHKSEDKGKGAYGEGAHSLTIGDCDGDGFDEIVYGSAAIDHDGSLLYRTGFGHGDALHLGDFDPDREGLEVFMVHEEKGSAYKYDAEFRDAKTGNVIWGVLQSGNDIGRGLVGDLSDNWRGYEVWPGSRYVDGERHNATFDCKGNIVCDNKVPSSCFRIYWDGDLNDELFDGKYNSDNDKSYPIIEKRTGNLNNSTTLMDFQKWSAQSCNSTKATPNLSADILGDWREEIILWDGDNSSDLLIFSTIIPTDYKVNCLMQDHQYRMAIAWQNTAYNQPPHLGYYLADSGATNAIVMLSEGNLVQVVEAGSQIEPISGKFLNATTLKGVNLPDGIVLDVDNAAQTWTLSGATDVVGVHNFRIETEGGESTGKLEGTLNVIEKVDLVEVAYLPFETLDGTDSFTTPNVGHDPGVVRGTPALVAGVVGNALDINKYGQRVTVKAYDDLQLGDSDFTIEFWLKTDDSEAYVFHKGSISDNSTGTQTGCWVGLEIKNNLFKFAIDDNVTKTEASASAADYLDAKWHYVVLVRETTTKLLRLFVDGKCISEATDNTGAIADNMEDLIIGDVNNSFDNRLNGQIDEFRISKGAMPAARVLANYEALKSAGIEEVTVSSIEGDADVTVYDAVTGRVVAAGYGEVGKVAANVVPGVYIVVKSNGKARETFKLFID
ncbi:MAG: LamG domain-containing protein [Lachnoclostridium sp.]|nr:LamG domain-containing protein [Lachnoclostridium sp.]